jgi:hypothetical protein
VFLPKVLRKKLVKPAFLLVAIADFFARVEGDVFAGRATSLNGNIAAALGYA